MTRTLHLTSLLLVLFCAVTFTLPQRAHASSGTVCFSDGCVYFTEDNGSWINWSQQQTSAYTVMNTLYQTVLNGYGWGGFTAISAWNGSYYQELGCYNGVVATTIVPPAPTGLQAICSANGTQVTLYWTGNSFAQTYPVRVNDPSTYTGSDCSNSTVNGPGRWCPTPTDYAYETGYSGITLTVQPGRYYDWWVNGWNPIGWSPSAISSFTCPAPSPTCTLSSYYQVESAGDAVFFSWSTTNASSFSIYPTPGSSFVSPVSSGSWTYYGPINQSTTFSGTASNGSSVAYCSTSVTVPTEPRGYSYTCSPDGGSATVSWGTSQNATSYALRVDNVPTGCNGITSSNPYGSVWCVPSTWSAAYPYTVDFADDNIPTYVHSVTFNISPAGSPVKWWVSGVSPRNPPFSGYGYDVYTYASYAYSAYTFNSFTCPALPPASCAVTFDTNPITQGSGTYLRWSSTNATNWVYINNVGYVASSGANWVAPSTTTDYSCTASGSGGSNGSHSATLTVNPPPPTASLTVSPTSIVSGHGAVVTWSSTNASSCTGTNFSTSNAVAGNINVSPSVSTTYSVSCTGAGGTAYDSKTITVTNPPPTCTVTADSTTLIEGQSTTLRWNSTYATSYSISSIGAVTPNQSSSAIIAPSNTTTYFGSVSGAGGNSSCGVTVSVSNPVLTLSASPTTVAYSGRPTVTWSATNVDSSRLCTLSGGGWSNTAVNFSGSQLSPQPLTANTTFTLSCQKYGNAGTVTRTAAVTISPATCSVTFDQNPITRGSGTTLRWNSTNASALYINTIGYVTANQSGSTWVQPVNTTDYGGTSTGPGANASCPATLTVACTPSYSCLGNTIQYTNSSCSTSNVTTCVSPAFCSAGSSTCLYGPPSFIQTGSNTGHLTIAPPILPKGTTTTITWNVGNVTSCSVTGTNGDHWTGASGSKTSRPIQSATTYTLSCTGLDNSNITERQTANILPQFNEQ